MDLFENDEGMSSSNNSDIPGGRVWKDEWGLLFNKISLNTCRSYAKYW